uniref:poly-gamma-glutamate hydrolase family protein n=2 Tax=Pseudomonadota TaxID=1224 RepID=UPI001954F22F
GLDRSNICNRAKLGMGVQFEITRALRVRLTDKKGQLTGPSLKDFVDAINEGLSQ